MLDFCKARLQMRLVMVVDQRDGAGDFAGVVFLPVFDELRADHVGDGERAVVVTLFVRHPVKLLEQRGRQRDGEARGDFFFHAGSNDNKGGDRVNPAAAVNGGVTKNKKCVKI